MSHKKTQFTSKPSSCLKLSVEWMHAHFQLNSTSEDAVKVLVLGLNLCFKPITKVVSFAPTTKISSVATLDAGITVIRVMLQPHLTVYISQPPFSSFKCTFSTQYPNPMANGLCFIGYFCSIPNSILVSKFTNKLCKKMQCATTGFRN